MAVERINRAGLRVTVAFLSLSDCFKNATTTCDPAIDALAIEVEAYLPVLDETIIELSPLNVAGDDQELAQFWQGFLDAYRTRSINLHGFVRAWEKGDRDAAADALEEFIAGQTEFARLTLEVIDRIKLQLEKFRHERDDQGAVAESPG